MCPSCPTGAVTHTISTSVIVFELTGQMTHMIPVLIAVLIANAICQTLELNIYDSIVQIKKLPFLPPIKSTSSSAHNIFVEDIMVREVVGIWRNCTYRDIKKTLSQHTNLQSFPLVDSGNNMILLGSIQRVELNRIAQGRLSRERRLQEVRRRYSFQDSSSDNEKSNGSTMYETIVPKDSPEPHKTSRFEVTPVHQPNLSPKQPVKSPKSILKHTVSFTYSPNTTITNMGAQGFKNLLKFLTCWIS